MKLKNLMCIALCLISSLSVAQEEEKYAYCLYSGYFGINSFLGGIAMELAQKDGPLTTESMAICGAAIAKGNKVGERVKNGSVPSEEDIQIIIQASKFSKRVYKSVIKGAGL